MTRRFQGFFAALAAAAVVAGHAPVASASALESRDTSASAATPVLFDAVVLRPLGLMITAAGAVGWALTTPIVAMTRPTDIMKPFRVLVAKPAAYTFIDPLGSHPAR